MSDAKILEKIKILPPNPGIYLFYNGQKELIYVGKATNLRNRVRSYFYDSLSTSISAKGDGLRPIEQMINQVKNIKFKETDSVLEAVISEANYIKKYQPKYNIDGKDDKSWNYIVITRDLYPRVLTLREHERQQMAVSKLQQKYQAQFGPYPGLKTKETLRLLQRLFFISGCNPQTRRPCLYYQMHQCLGVCTGEISPDVYQRRVIRPLINFLSGHKQVIATAWAKQMCRAAAMENFEEAARLRNQLASLRHIQDVALLHRGFVVDENVISSKVNYRRIESYDISNFGASGQVGGMIVWELGKGPIKSAYRKFNIKTVHGPNDVGCLREILERRVRHFDWPLPDVFLIDGGKPQINVARAVLVAAKIDRPIIGIAKGPKRRRNDLLVIGSTAVANWARMYRLDLIQARNEVHRYALSFQKQKRKIKI